MKTSRTNFLELFRVLTPQHIAEFDQKVLETLQDRLTWFSGEVYFEVKYLGVIDHDNHDLPDLSIFLVLSPLDFHEVRFRQLFCIV